MDNQKLQQKFLEKVKSQVSSANFKTFFSQTSIEFQEDGKVTFATPSAFIKETLNQRHLPLIEVAMEKILGEKVQIEFIIKQKSNGELNDEEVFQIPQKIEESYLNPKFRLENFVVGPSNNVAYAAALAVVQNPGTSYNPLFIYGGTGVGKTHLMIAIGNAILKKKPNLKVNYSTSEKFTNDYVEAIQNRRMMVLRTKYRSPSLLLVDDVQFFSGREQTQEEFFHTFNELTSKNSQIILTSDRPPQEMPKLEDRLKSRFQGGLMVDIAPPDLDTRVAILRAKCKERGEFLPEECLTLIASHVASNARELEGKLILILQVLKTQNLPPTPDVIQRYLGLKAKNKIQNLSAKEVISIVSNFFNIKTPDLTGPRRQKGLVLPRHIAMHILSEDLNLTVEKIGEILGGRDHTTVMHGRDKIKNLLLKDPEVQRTLIEIKQKLSTN